MTGGDTVFIVDSDADDRETLGALFAAAGFTVAAFDCGEALFAAGRTAARSCVVLDIATATCGTPGLETLGRLVAEDVARPVIVISGQGDIPTAVAAIKEGARDFIEKPIDGERLVELVRSALADCAGAPADETCPDFPGRALLTPREQQVLGQITAGHSNKEAGRRLGISPRTVEVHRARIMEKLGAKNAADLVRIALTGGKAG
ncbi:MAG: LuxR C-terminal-related transcriptional regulator [Hyphomicrobiales bacterium]